MEKVVLGSVFTDFRTTDLVTSSLRKEDFYDPNSAIIFQSFLDLKSKGLKIDMVSCVESIKSSDPTFSDIDFIFDCSNQVGTTAHIQTHIDLLKNISVKRQLQEFGYRANKLSVSTETTGKEDLSKFIADAENLLNRVTFKKIETFEEEAASTIREIIDNDGAEIGLTTGFEFIDQSLSGLCAPDFTVLAAGPGEGKSTFALNISKHVAKKYGRVMFFSLEMKAKQIIYKLLSDEFDTPVSDVRTGKVNPEDLLNSTIGKSLDLKIIDKGSMAVDELSAICRFEQVTNPVKLIVVDYLQLLGVGNYGKSNQNRTNEVSIISRKLKELAMDLNIPVIALSQLNRQKGRTTYRKSDLRESGSIEQDADNIGFIFRPSEHKMHTYDFGNGYDEQVSPEDAIIIIDKCRLGQTGQRRFTFKGDYSRFEDYNENDTSFTNTTGTF